MTLNIKYQTITNIHPLLHTLLYLIYENLFPPK